MGASDAITAVLNRWSASHVKLAVRVCVIAFFFLLSYLRTYPHARTVTSCCLCIPVF
jgi:hypothetical protein